MEIASSLLDAIFGEDSNGSTPEERAQTSSQIFVRSTHELSFFVPGATGTTFTAKQALNLFGIHRLIEIVEDGSAIFTRNTKEPFATIKKRRESLGLDGNAKLIAKKAKVTEKEVFESENPLARLHIRTLEKIARELGLDPNKLSVVPGAGGDPVLGVRLKSWSDSPGRLPARSIAAFSEAAWVIETQVALQRLLEPQFQIPTFEPTFNYGNSERPVYRIADDLSQRTRSTIGLSSIEAITSLRDICHRLRIPLINQELAPEIAGATIESNGARGIIVNTRGKNENSLVRRATIAHELGHLLWDPSQKLKGITIDKYGYIESLKSPRSTQPDYLIEARANAFAIELIAPKESLRSIYSRNNDINDVMLHFGISASAAKYHIWNAFNRQIDLPVSEDIDNGIANEWRGAERFEDDQPPIPETPQSRRGYFSVYVVMAQRAGWLTEQTAADYLMTDEETYRAKSQEILDLFPEV
ncbi:ImmA/IrrE family metallo-endopeptidase [Armatimonas sp.]|uniref:ImmA/IrrE family metallo-endopeptidase n=1 Tax=Armatimonas sp. TaxID=1872638 RepID=UPI00374FFDFC